MKFASISIDRNVAIRLGKIPEHDLPCISNFEAENEVLVGPRTFFKVKQIEQQSSKLQYIIHLENLIGEHKTILKTLRFFLKTKI